jgi:hypothetical protein
MILSLFSQGLDLIGYLSFLQEFRLQNHWCSAEWLLSPATTIWSVRSYLVGHIFEFVELILLSEMIFRKNLKCKT